MICLIAQQAIAFGTIAGGKWNKEHERITRHALACGEAGGPQGADCFQAASIDELAGKRGTFGAVGSPDNPVRGLMSTSEAHCDNGDYLDPRYAGGRAYPRTKEAARAKLETCRTWMRRYLDAAVSDAAALLDGNRVRDSQIPTYVSCTYVGGKGRAKCNVLEDFGTLLHATQDFYSHSNWSDAPDPGRPISRENPPGLHRDGPSPWLDLRLTNDQAAFPDGLITGCFETLLPGSDQNGCPGRVPHEYLNKDTGTIDDAASHLAPGAGTSPRGMVDDNFKRAVSDAILDTREQWRTLREALVARYGQARGALIICAITHDDAAKVCR
jgi:hypothetical protein